MSTSYLPQRDYLAIKAACRALIDRVGGGRACTTVTGRARNQAYSEFGSPDHLDRWLPLREVLELEADIEDPIVTRQLAAMLGFDLVAMPKVEGGANWHKLVGEMGKEAGEAIAVVHKALSAGGKITEQENLDMEIERELTEAIVALTRLRLAVQSAKEMNDAC